MKGAKESAVLAEVLAYLRRRGDCFFWRHNVAAAVLGGRFVRSSMRGVPDILCCHAPSGQFVGIECKREVGGKLSVDQQRFKESFEVHGGLYCVARSFDDVALALGPVMVNIPNHQSRKRPYNR